MEPDADRFANYSAIVLDFALKYRLKFIVAKGYVESLAITGYNIAEATR